jgi:hypothetical protein
MTSSAPLIENLRQKFTPRMSQYYFGNNLVNNNLVNNNNNNSENSNNDDNFKRIYLCVKSGKNDTQFICNLHTSFQEADNKFREQCFTSKVPPQSTMISISRFVPHFIDVHLLHHKLSKLFVNVTIK